jgi:hypothetical protein
VKEAPVDEEGNAVLGEHYIRLSRKIRPVKPESETEAMQECANLHFRSGIFRTNHPHDLASCFSIESIGH